jgi:hypothetical protein
LVDLGRTHSGWRNYERSLGYSQSNEEWSGSRSEEPRERPAPIRGIGLDR